MATMVGTQKEIGSLLNQLLELEYDALEAYGAAIQRLKDTTYRTRFEAFRSDHERHVTELTAEARQIGIEPATKGDMKQILTKGKVVLGSLVGDRAILMAMKTNEDDTNTAYERAAGRTDLPASVRTVAQRNLADERRHRSWIEERLAADHAGATP